MESKGKGRGYLLSLEGLEELFERLKKAYRVIAPELGEGVIVFSEVDRFERLPLGYRNVEGPGFYALEKAQGYFTYTHPYNSPRSFLHPPELTLMRVRRENGRLAFETSLPEGKLCLFDVRACDLSALKVLDLVCEHGHIFEGWFGSEDDYTHQRETGLLACPVCGSRAVHKGVSA
ncbi:MAG: DUF1178 family protein, partial [Aquificaceae bacterium]